MVIKAGSTLLVHRKGRLDNDVTEHLADNAQLGLSPEVVLRRISVKARQGDTLASLAARHGVSEANIADWNKLKPKARVSSGQSFTILVPSQASRRVGRAPPPKSARQAAPRASDRSKAKAKPKSSAKSKP
jgi:membrane-bound lytic murein transglycosylase D